MTMKNLLNCDGVKFKCLICNEPSEGVIYVSSNTTKVFLFQNTSDGDCPDDCDDFNGFKFSWYVRDGSINALDDLDVTDLRLYNEDIREYVYFTIEEGGKARYNRKRFIASKATNFQGAILIEDDYKIYLLTNIMLAGCSTLNETGKYRYRTRINSFNSDHLRSFYGITEFIIVDVDDNIEDNKGIEDSNTSEVLLDNKMDTEDDNLILLLI